MAIRPNSRSVAVSAGKGLTTEAAVASCMMEALECFHAENILLPLFRGAAEDFANAFALSDMLPKYSSVGPVSGQLVWIEAASLIDERRSLIPFELVSADFTQPVLPGFGAFLQSTNGLASGNCREEAVLHALCEVIERDSMALWQRCSVGERAKTLIDEQAIGDPNVKSLVECLNAANFEVAIWDVTTEIGVPVFHCALLDRWDREGHHGTGSGCHPNSAYALQRAVLEAAQVRLTYVSGARDDIERFDYSAHARARALMRLSAEVSLGRRFGNAPAGVADDLSSGDIAEDLAWVLQRLADAGLTDIFVVDLSKPEFGFSVVKVVVPNLIGPEAYPFELATRRESGKPVRI
jgi:YcaO-like protein with predicted kinase domain